MSKYVNADMSDTELLQIVQEQTADADTFITVRRILNSLPKEDVEPVIHAHWEYAGSRASKRDIKFYYRCTKCGRLVTFRIDELRSRDDKYVQEAYPYCNCGAKMYEEVK